MRVRPAVHGLTDVPAIDEAKITGTVEQSNRAFRMLHVRGLGAGVLILVAATAAAQLAVSEWIRLGLTIPDQSTSA